MEYRRLNSVIAGGIFFASLAAYVVTLSPTVTFWDPGEFCAAAYSLQVPHPPGAPLFLLLARVASMLPFAQDIAMRMHLVSAVASALACALLYLLTVQLIVARRGLPETRIDRTVVYGSAVVGSLSLTFSPTFWFGAVEAEVYGVSMLFISGIVWLGLRWYEQADDTRGAPSLLLISYIIGLAVGVHFIAILALFPVMLLYYFKSYEFSVTSFVKFGILALITFGIVYPGIVKTLPSLLGGEFAGVRSGLIRFIPPTLLAASLYGVYYSIKKQNRLLNQFLLSFLFIVLGYSTYTLVYIRSNAAPPMNVNDPSTITRLVSYLSREQYGEEPMLDRRWNKDNLHRPAIERYTSDFDYFWKYQFVHMYLRYLGWNYIGAEGDWKDAGVNWRQLYGIPLFLGLLGAFYHWRKDPKTAAVASAAFLVLGLALVINRNFQEPEVRERDYFFVGSFFIFSMWIGIGVLGVIDWIRRKNQSTRISSLTAYGSLVLAFMFVPLNMLRTNFHQANRTGNYVAWDYSYNVLQSCDQDAILFTNGDNDTFPLWYLQDVEGIRRDVRVVSLSLLNTNWYILQLKHQQPFGAKVVPVSLPDDEIGIISQRDLQPGAVRLPVPADVTRQFGVQRSGELSKSKVGEDGSPDSISFTMPSTIEYGGVKSVRVQDIMVLDIVATTHWQRPIYFAMTVPAEAQIGLKDYLQLEGLAFRLTPKKATSLWSNVDEQRTRAVLGTDIGTMSKTAAVGCRWRGLQDSTVYLDEDIRHFVSNYRQAFILLARHYVGMPGMASEAVAVLDRMEQVLPRRVREMDSRTTMYVAGLYKAGGDRDKCDELCAELMSELKPVVARGAAGPLNADNPHVLLLQTYETMGRFDDALRVTDIIGSVYAGEKNLDLIVGQTRAALMAERGAAHQRDSLALKGAAKMK